MKGNEERIITENSKDKSDRWQWKGFLRIPLKRSLSCITAAALSIISPAILAIPGIPGGVTALAEEADGAAMGRYMESEVALPEGCETFAIWDIRRTEDGTLRVAARDQDGVGMWDSSDGGETWEEKVPFSEQDEQSGYDCIALAPDGGGAAVIYTLLETEEGFDLTYHYASFDGQGNIQMGADLTDFGITDLFISPEGQVIGRNSEQKLYFLDRATGEVNGTGMEADALTVGFCNGELFSLTYQTRIQRFDLETGEPLGRDEALEAALDDGTDYMSLVSTSAGAITIPLVFAEDAEGRLYYSNSTGIYSYLPGGSVVEQVVNGSLNSLSNPASAKIAMEVMDNVFYVAYCDGEQTDGILKYEFDENISTVPERELTIYSLEENKGIQQTAIMFQKTNPDFCVNYQVGMTGEDGVTAADALRLLNTDILAGNGPDVLILDGMSVDTYAGQGVLADLGGILTELEEREGLFENIVYAYESDGTVPAVPTRFGIPVAVGTADTLEKLNSVQDLVELSAEEGNLDSMAVGRLLDNLYYVCCGSWKQPDNTMDQEKLTEYLEALQQVYQNFAAYADETMMEEVEYKLSGKGAMNTILASAGYNGFMSPDTMRFYAGVGRVSLGVLAGMLDYYIPTSVELETGDCKIEPLTGQQSEVYLPVCTVGVLNTSKDPEGAMELVSYLLSAEGELANQYQGFPVNEKAFDAVLHEKTSGEAFSGIRGIYDNSDTSVNLRCFWPTEEELTWLAETAASLTNPADINRVQEDVIKEEARRCMTGEVSVEEAANSIMQKINLYLAE